MKKSMILAIAALAIIVSCQPVANTKTADPLPAAPAEDSVTICHSITLRGHTTRQTLTIPTSYLNVHLAHGDYIGACQ